MRTRTCTRTSLLRIVAAAGLLLAGCESLIGLDDRKLIEPPSDVGSDDGGVGDGASAGSDGGAPPALCQEYCRKVQHACTGDYAVYASEELCQEVCAELPAGDEPEGNTIMCRLEIASFITEPAADCPAAGPGGAGRCGENCESYCMLMDRVCDEFRSPDVDTCIAQCAALRDRDDDPTLEPEDSRFSAASSAATDHDGDTVQCRLYHASVSTTPLGAEAHCWHAQLAPRPLEGASNPCLKDIGQTEARCADYCRIISVACTDDNAVYESEAQCLAVCAAMPPGDMADSGGQNTRGCRYNHAYNALVGDPITHCPHAGPSGSTVCGDDCDSYCTQLADACPDGFAAQYGDDPADASAACADACADRLEGEPRLLYSVTDDRIAELPELGCLMRATARAQVDPSVEQCEIALGLSSCE